LTKIELAARLRRHVRHELYDDSSGEPHGFAVYSLADPRDLRLIRYVGQTAAPVRRFAQHLSTARLWLPDEPPWWVQQPRLRPLYDWLRALYADEQRLPTMVVHRWVGSAKDARLAERAHVYEALVNDLPLLNVESEWWAGQLPLDLRCATS
jgi:hypothetical protein